MCPHHHYMQPDNWAKANRVWCDLLHRKIPLPSMPTEHLGMTRQEYSDIFVTAGGDLMTAGLVWRAILDEDEGPLTIARVTEMAKHGRYIHAYQGDFGGYA